MPLVKELLVEELIVALTAGDGDENSETATRAVADKLASAIDKYIKSGIVQTSVTTSVTTAGTAVAQTGVGAGTGIGSIT